MARREPETARIRAVTHEGQGIADLPGKKVFVAGALEGEEVRFQRRKKRRNYDEAELLEVISPSESRIEPRCEAFGRCGGCVLQHVSADEQRALKSRVLRDSLERIGRVSPDEWLQPLTAGEGWNYRRRARLAVKDVPGKGRVLVGFRERHSPYVTDMHRCEVLREPLDALIDPLSELIAGLSIRRRLPQVEIAVADNATELVFRVLDPPTGDDIRAMTEFGNDHGLRISLQPKGPTTVYSITGNDDEEPLVYRLDAFNVEIAFAPTDFVQVNGAINEAMVARAIELLDVDAEHRVLDLYCGIGNFTLPLARKAARVLGIEGEEQQVIRARSNATRNAIDNAEFTASDLSAIDENATWLNDQWDRILLDPARSGALEVVKQMSRLRPRKIVYVSCHPGTLARDAGELVNAHGYKLEAAGIIDMFPHTAHVESIAVFARGE